MEKRCGHLWPSAMNVLPARLPRLSPKYCFTGRSFGLLLQYLTGSALFQRALALSQIAAERIQPSFITDSGVIVTAALTGGPLLVLGAFSAVDLLRFALPDPDSPPGRASAVIVDPKAGVLAHDGAPPLESDYRSHPGIRAALEGTSGSSYANSPNGEEHVLAFSAIRPAGWVLMIEEPWHSVASPVLRLSLLSPLALVPALTISLLALWLAARQISARNGPPSLINEKAELSSIGQIAHAFPRRKALPCSGVSILYYWRRHRMIDHVIVATTWRPLVRQLIHLYREQGLSVRRTFDLQVARRSLKPADKVPCPHHGLGRCTCQYLVLQIRRPDGDSIALVVHGRDDKTEISLLPADSEDTDRGIAAEVYPGLARLPTLCPVGRGLGSDQRIRKIRNER
jgi:hypothetical protein